jgi:hypothetical protein
MCDQNCSVIYWRIFARFVLYEVENQSCVNSADRKVEKKNSKLNENIFFSIGTGKILGDSKRKKKE